ncbi:MAG: cytochrome C oxidase subunit IV family protein [Verrucomicrobiae bacterium]|nr:cytochrome C oxidase subunit IV family protein [Verrucomicrobiae bacterium]MCB1085667.1 cytochrome C oxidase subunit IV family protein [Verrucomicrobiae bacterium]MCB1089986.1 cytochrome C oxidase subunit IV family protein [Verrucomicrobiae bacterium]
MASSQEELDRLKKSYIAVGIALGVFTVVTVVTAHWLHPFGPVMGWRDVALGLLIASVKSSLVALIFMHLNHERGLIYKVLLFTLCFFLSLMVLTLFALINPVHTAFDSILNHLR